MYDRTNKKDREGYQYKIYSKEHISWIRRINNLDSAGNNLSYGTGASGTYEVEMIHYLKYSNWELIDGRKFSPKEGFLNLLLMLIKIILNNLE